MISGLFSASYRDSLWVLSFDLRQFAIKALAGLKPAGGSPLTNNPVLWGLIQSQNQIDDLDGIQAVDISVTVAIAYRPIAIGTP